MGKVSSKDQGNDKVLILIRHAKSAWNTEALTDFERPLSARGLNEAPCMGAWLHEWLEREERQLDVLISSPAKRAAQTAYEIARPVGIAASEIIWNRALYLASKAMLEDVAKSSLQHVDCVALVGHNPGLDYLLSAYCPQAPRTGKGKLMTTANVAVIGFSGGQLTAKAATLRVLKRPAECV